MQEVHTLSRLGVPPTVVCTVWMFGLKRRGVRRCENETFLPKPGPLPHMSQTEATVCSSDRGDGSGEADSAVEGGAASRRSLPDAHPPVLTEPNVAVRFYAA